MYLLKQKAEDKLISSTYLWKEVYKNIEVSTPWDKLKKNLLLFAQILTVLLLIFAMTDPFLTKGGKEFKNVIVVIDNSGSMNARYNERTRFEAAILKAQEYVQSLKGGASISIISVGKSTKIDVSRTTDKEIALKKLKEIKITDAAGNINESLSLVRSMAEQLESYEVVFFTDQSLDLKELNGSIVNLQKDGTNASVDFVHHAYDKDGLKVLVKLTNRSNSEMTTDINLYGDSELLDIKNISLTSKESKVIYFNKLNFKGKIIRAEIHEKDDLIQDNTAYDVIKKGDIQKVLLVSPKNMFMEKVLATVPNLEVYKTNSLEDIKLSDSFDLYIFDGVKTPTLPKSGSFLFINPLENELFNVSGMVEGGVVISEENGLTKHLSNMNFVVEKLKNIQTPSWSQSFFKVDNRTAGFIGEYKTRKVAVFAFDLHQSDWVLKADFPIFIHNLMGQLVDTGIVNRTSYISGDDVELNAIADGKEIKIKIPSEAVETIPLRFPLRRFTNTMQTGIYKATQNIGEEEREGYFAVNFPTDSESDLISTGQIENQTNQKDTTSIGGKTLQLFVVIGALIFLAVEWFIYVKGY